MNRTTISTRKTRRTALALLSLSVFLLAACNLNGAGGIVAEVANAQSGAVDTAPDAPPGTGTGTETPPPAPVATHWTAIASGSQHSVGLNSDGELYAWGGNTYGQLGDGTTTTRLTPTRVGSASDWTYVAAGDEYSLAINSRGELYTWGHNLFNQLGDGTTTDRSTPTRIGLPGSQTGTASDWTRVVAGNHHSLATTSDDTLYGWGYNVIGELGADTGPMATPTAGIWDPAVWTRLAVGNSHNLGIDPQGALYTWGYNLYGRLGDGTTTTRLTPVRISLPGSQTGSDNWTEVAAGDSYSLAITTAGELYAWGRNDFGQVGDGTNTDRLAPVRIGLPGSQTGSASNWARVAADDHSLAINDRGELYAWGKNDFGQVGDETTTHRSTPVRIGSASDWAEVAARETHSLALTTAGELYAWGSNGNGQLGDGTTADRTGPIKIANPW